MEVLDTKDVDSQFNRYLKRLLPFAYNIIGDLPEAEDVVQDTVSNYFLQTTDHVENPDSYLTRSVINRAITSKKRIQTRKEHYHGHWLPSPIQTEEQIYSQIDKDRVLNYSLMVLLERLSPKERAVFILKESFDFAHDEIAELLEITVENSRQLFKRAHQKLEPDFTHSSLPLNNPHQALTELTSAILHADIEKVKNLLSEDVRSVSDGGRKHKAAPKIINGQHNVAKWLEAMFGKYFIEGSQFQFTMLNHQPAILFRSPDDLIYRCVILELVNDSIRNTYVIVNPDKLQSFQSKNLSR